MNLIQIQDRLKQLPQDPRTMQVLTSYANGANPEVPPYLALAEIQRRNKEQQAAQVAQPPEGTVKDRAEAEALKQSANLMAAQQQQQQQMQQMPQQAPQQMQEQMQEPMQAANGGIMRLPVRDEMFNFADGGIVAFAAGDVVDYKAKAAEYLNKQPDIPKTYSELMQEAIAKNPELAKPAGQGAERQIQALAAQDTADKAKFEERERSQNLSDFSRALIEAGEASRGQRGLGGLGTGFVRSYNQSQAAANERKARQEAVQREQQLNILKLNSEIENLRRAEARGDVAEEQKSLAKIAEIRNELSKNQANLGVNLGQLATQEDTLAENIRAHKADEVLKSRQIDQMGSVYKPQVIQMAEYLRGKYPNMSEQELLDMAAKYTNQGISGGNRLDAATMESLRKIEDDYRLELRMAANDPKKLAEVQARKDAEIRSVMSRAGGISSLPQSGQPAQGNTRIRVDEQGNPI
jgi:hypothetical protein